MKTMAKFLLGIILLWISAHPAGHLPSTLTEFELDIVIMLGLFSLACGFDDIMNKD
jgi:hypothetical protein